MHPDHDPLSVSVRRRSARLLASVLVSTATPLALLAQTSVAPVPTEEVPAAERPSRESEDSTVVMEKFTVVGGFRGSLAAAAEIKRVTPAIAEVIAAEDIGKMPDISIADSLTRLTGLASQRLNGRSQALSIRGLTGDFSTGLLNGREQVSAGSNRAVEFDQYPAELLSGAVVYKTTDASLVGQGLSGTIDLRTVRPLSQGRRTIAGNAFYDWTELDALNAGSKTDGYRYTFSYIDQFKDDTVGIAFGYAHADIPGQGEQWNAWGYPNVDASVDPSQPAVIGGAKPFVRSSELERDGFMGVIEFKPGDQFHSTLDLFYSQLDETQQLRGIEIPLYWSSAQLQPGFTVTDGLITQGRFNNVFGVVRNDIVLRNTDVYAGGWNLKFGDGSGWTTVADLSYSKIERTDPVLETYSGSGSNLVGTPDSMGFAMQGGTGAVFTPTLNYTDPNLIRLSSPQGWGGDTVPGGQVGYYKSFVAEDELKQAKLFTRRDLSRWFANIEIGAAFTDRSKSEIEDSNYLALANGQTSASLPPSIGITDLSFIGIPGMVSYDPIAALNSGIYRVTRNQASDVTSTNWEVSEKVSLAYVKVGLDDKIGSLPVTGNFGFQVAATDQASNGLSATGSGASLRTVPVSGGDDYIDFIPSVNLSFHLSETRVLKFSVARQLARQRMSDMRAGTNFTYNPALASSTDPFNGPWTGSGGTPGLKPWKADSVDLSLEQYFRDNMGYFSIAGFYKDLRTYTYTQTQLADYTGFPTSGVTPAIFQGTVSRPVNGEGGSIQGVEFTLSLASEMLTDAIPGLGVVLGGALTDSSIERNGPGSPTSALPGLSEKVANATVYYERAGFSARVGVRYRSDYLANVNTFGKPGENFRTVSAETVVDAQVSYTFQGGPLKNLTVIVQGNNLNDEPLSTYDNDARYVIDYQRYGATYSAGVSYKF